MSVHPGINDLGTSFPKISETSHQVNALQSNVGGPPVGPMQISCDNTLFNSVQNAAEGCCASEGNGPLCAALAAGQVWSQEPFNALINQIVNYADCNEELDESRLQAAWEAFAAVTGLNSDTFSSFNQINTNTFVDMVNLNSFYIFFPIMFLLLIAVWFMVGFGWFTWPAGLFLSVLVVVVLYIFSVSYRIHAQSVIRARKNQLQSEASQVKKAFENSVAYWPQGIFAVSSSVTSETGDGWLCNAVEPCPPCPSRVPLSRPTPTMPTPPTQMPAVQAPTVQPPTTQAPIQPPTTQAPTTQAPVQPPTTQAPVTQAPVQAQNYGRPRPRSVPRRN